MDLDPDNIDDETINAIFRSAHSIKGGSATFGFRSIAEFTHILETLLDQVRAGSRGLTGEDINLFLRSVDCMREMLSLLQEGDDSSTELSRELEQQFKRLLGEDEGGDAPAAAAPKTAPAASAPKASPNAKPYWRIKFLPSDEILKSGNDPFRILRELSELGEMTAIPDIGSLPVFSAIDPESCYLAWDIELHTDADESAIKEPFSWVEDSADIHFEKYDPNAEEKAPEVEENIVWRIEFHPNKDILITGNDPLKIFAEMEKLGKLTAEADASSLPNFMSLSAEECHLSWVLHLETQVADKEEIMKFFEWVMDEADIKVTAISGVFAKNEETPEKTAAVNAAENTAAQTVTPAPEAAAKKAEPEKAAPAKAASKVSKIPQKKAQQANNENSSIRVGIDKVDNLINMVGELVITQSMLGQLSSEFETENMPKLLEGLNQLEQNTRELQESVMRIRMLPISFAFSRFPRMVRDLSQTLGKKVNLKMLGEHTELDKTVMEKIGDPLVHLVRNAVDHGIEMPADRTAKGKHDEGKITLNAYHQGGNVVIEIIDDGKGLHPEKLKEKAVEKGVITQQEADALTREQCFDLIFQPGFSTAQQVSDISGRGVGMDVVKRNIQALNGVIEITSEVDRGSTIRIRLPLTLAILDGQLVRVGDNTYVLPITSIVESLQAKKDFINKLAGGNYVLRLRDEYVPIIKLSGAFNIRADSLKIEESLLVVVESDNGKVAIVVDELLAQQQVVIKSLEQNYRRVEGISGATILGDGTVALIVDIPGVVRLVGKEYQATLNAPLTMLHHTHESSMIGKRA